MAIPGVVAPIVSLKFGSFYSLSEMSEVQTALEYHRCEYHRCSASDVRDTTPLA